jgi:hypothetical protein
MEGNEFQNKRKNNFKSLIFLKIWMKTLKRINNIFDIY